MKTTHFVITVLLACVLQVDVSVTQAADQSPEKDSQLADAAEGRKWDLLVELLENSNQHDKAQADGMTALHWAVHHGHSSTVQRLIASKANVNAATQYRITPLSLACRAGNASIVDHLLDARASVNVVQAGGETPLMIAARTGNAKVVQSLILKQATIDAKERNGQTALMWAAAEGNVKAVWLLLKAGAKIDLATASGFTALLFAVREGRSHVVERLIAAGADVNASMQPKSSGPRAPRKGTTALILAVESGHFELAMFLVRKGANTNDQQSGFTALHVLSWVRKPNRGENPQGDPSPRGSGKLTALQFAEAIVKSGANVNARLKTGREGRAVLNLKGATPFLMAARTADLALMKTLLKLGADPKITNVDGTTPLMAAAGVGVRAVGEEAGTEPEVLAAIEFLLKLGAQIDAVDRNKETAMHGAAYRNFPKVVALLARRGADDAAWNHKNKWGWTPISIAQGNRPGSFKPSPETVRALKLALSP